MLSSLLALIKRFRLKPHQIELEVTETALLHRMDHKLEVLTQLKKHGFRLALDDFGTGYSSLNYLNRLPFDRVKLDKSFIDLVDVSRKDRLIVEAIIDLSHRIGLSVIAEGVERWSQEQVLKSLKCDYIQGYLCGKPEDKESVTTSITSFTSFVDG